MIGIPNDHMVRTGGVAGVFSGFLLLSILTDITGSPGVPLLFVLVSFPLL
jgi:hypothetical protein